MEVIRHTSFVLVISLWLLEPTVCEERAPSAIARLRSDILRTYDKRIPPSSSNTNETVVTVAMFSRYIQDLDEKNHRFTMDAWMDAMWNDDNAKWEPEKYDGVTSVVFEHEELWTPRFVVVWGSPTSSLDPYTRSPVYVDHTGYVVWYPSAVFRTQCILDYTYYPNDQQTCSFNITAISFYGQAIDLYAATEEVELKLLSNTNPKWILVGTKVEKQKLPYGQAVVRFSFTLKRRMAFGGDVEWALSVISLLLTLIMFWMPPERGKKLTVGLTSLLLLFGELLFFTVSSPSPEIALYTARMIQQAVFAVLSAIVLEIIVLNFTRITEFPPPGVLLDVLSGPARKFLCFCPQDPKKTTLQKDWYIIALGCDRILFLLYVIVFVSLRTWV